MSAESLAESNASRRLAFVLRGIGCLDLLALAAVLMPERWMEIGHHWAGLGALPREPIVGYLARSASALYALHGAMVLLISFDVSRYEKLIRFMAWAALLHGAVILGIDLAQHMPAYWRYGEGPIFAATGLLVLGLQRSQLRTRSTTKPNPTTTSIAQQ